MRHRADPSAVGPAAPESGDDRRSVRVRVGVGAAVALAIVAAVVAVLVSATAQQGSSVDLGTPVPSSAGATNAAATATAAGRLLLHVTGAVRDPGIVDLPAGSRVLDAVAAAGGAADGADIAALNLARPVADGEQLVVPRVGDPPPAGGAGAGGVASGSGSAGSASGAPLNLNTATPAELETLPRIGPALAQRIVDWRAANGRFGAVSDLMKVSGIGQKLFDGLKDRVVV
ncbi:ComEA family DNA-binding protein [Leifsonia soli]|uniref:Competence protein ComEA n=1 Tax=Leifsonia soli TaxID=582665 RepID=A0A852SXM5_9MICO|nr:ComEA family DNA-binding protein [Leifsonia soli]NYD73422.1 competence protein ComEA [Leifsonia soli]